ncbi:MAG: EAL domain-containing protein [Lachnospiraceae bacterium]|nr:EAL domain-containing protein [Lachnospiraceae bacterium]
MDIILGDAMTDTKEYTITELKKTMSLMSKIYDLVRLVDPRECCQLRIDGDRLVYEKVCYAFWDAKSRCKECSSYQACLLGRHKDRMERYRGMVYQIQSYPIVIRREEGEPVHCVMELIMVHKASQEEEDRYQDKVKKEAGFDAIKTDPLTGLYNWEGFSQTARQMLVDCKEPMDCVVSEVIQYDLVEGLFGSEVLDQVLMGIADICREYDKKLHLFGRLERGRYVMMVSHNTFQPANIQEGMKKVGELLTDSMFRLQVRSGVYCIDDKTISVQEMVGRALMALNKVRNHPTEVIAWFDEDMKEELDERKAVVMEFDQALRDGEYHLFLKPQLGEGGLLEGAEAKSCRVRRDGTVDDPADFLETLEEAGLVARLDRYMWEKAIALLSRWKNGGKEEIHITVKVSAADFYYMDVAGILQDLVKRYDIRPERLWVEVKEKAVLSDQKRMITELERVREAGFALVIDDFGKGASALSILTQVRIDAVRLDREVTEQAEDPDAEDRLLEAIVTLAEVLKIRVYNKGTKILPIPVRAFERKYLSN